MWLMPASGLEDMKADGKGAFLCLALAMIQLMSCGITWVAKSSNEEAHEAAETANQSHQSGANSNDKQNPHETPSTAGPRSRSIPLTPRNG